MAGDKIEKLMEPLQWLKENTIDIETAAIINSQEGLIIASTCTSDVEEQNIAAITSTVHASILNLSSNLKKNGLKKFVLETENGYITIAIINEETLLTVLSGKKTNLGLIFLNIKKTLKKMAEIIQE